MNDGKEWTRLIMLCCNDVSPSFAATKHCHAVIQRERKVSRCFWCVLRVMDPRILSLGHNAT